MSSEHAPLPPSGAPQWGKCSGSIMAQAHAPDIEHPRTRAGSASHWVASECLLSWSTPMSPPARCSDWLGREAPNGVIVDEEMAEGAQVYVDHVLQIAQKHGALGSMLIEHRVEMPQIHPQNWGTLDLCIPLLKYDENGLCGGVVYVIDYKFGHRQVKAEGNLQLIDYFAGILNEFKIDGYVEQGIDVVFQVVQPFCYQNDGPVDSWFVKAADLRGYYNQLEAKANEALTCPTFSSGPHCRDCKAITSCATAKRSHYSLIDYVNDAPEIDSMTGEDLATEREILRAGAETLKSRVEAIEEELKHRVGKGESDSGLTLENGEGRLAWTVPAAQAISFAAQFGVDASKSSVLTPTQVIAKAPADLKPVFKQALEAVTKRPSTGLKLVKAADSRTARAFSKKGR